MLWLRPFLPILLAMLLPRPTMAQVSIQDLYEITGQLLRQTPHRPEFQIIPDQRRAMGRAAVYGTPARIVFYVNPQIMRLDTPNTWAFYMGHELGHPLLGLRGGTPRVETACDEFGADLAIKAGADVDAFVTAMLRRPNICSRTHGCEYDRYINIANKFSGTSRPAPPEHAACDRKPATGFPAGKSSPGPSGCWNNRPQQCRGHQCFLPGQRQPCNHPMRCRHLVQGLIGYDPWGRPIYGPVPAHGADPRHPEGDAVPSPFCLRPRMNPLTG